MKTPKEMVVYACGDKIFGTYNIAFSYYKQIRKPIYYVFTPTWHKFRHVSDLDSFYQKYLKENFDATAIDFNHKILVKQLNFWKGEIKK